MSLNLSHKPGFLAAAKKQIRKVIIYTTYISGYRKNVQGFLDAAKSAIFD